MTIPTKSLVPAKGQGTTLWMLKDASDISLAVAAPEDDSFWDQIGNLSTYGGQTSTKEISTVTYLDDESGFASKITGEKDAGDIAVTIAYKPGDATQRRLVTLFNATGSDEWQWFRAKHPNDAVNMFYCAVASLGNPTSSESGTHMMRELSLSVDGAPKLAEELQTA